MTFTIRKSQLAFSLALSLVVGRSATAATPGVKDALSLQPVQKDVEIERPEAATIEKCTIKAEGKRGWVVRDGGGQILRTFTDTNGDNVVDQWCYFKDGVEVYRDIDSNFNRKADQCRWMNTGGSRWGVDRNEDGKIDLWKTISPEEVTAELVAAMRDRDRERFERILLNASELKTIGAGPAKTEQLKKKTEVAAAGFAKMAAGQTVVAPGSKWVSFGGMQPGIVPAGTDEATSDLNVYENVMAMVETEGKAAPLSVGTLVRVGETWRLIDLPTMSEGGTEPFFFPMPRPQQPDGAPVAGQPSERMQAIMKELQALPDLASSTPDDHAKRVDLLKQLATEDPENRGQWYQQIADSLGAAVQTGGYEAGISKLRELVDELAKNPADEELAFQVEWRWMTAKHGDDLAQPKSDFPTISTKWIEDVTAFVDKSKKYPLSGEALMELAISQELGGDDTKALEAYSAVVKDYPHSPLLAKAAGAKARLESPGKSITLKGKQHNGNAAFDLAEKKGKVVLIQYWATWSDLSKADMPLLKELRTKYGKDFEVVGVCLDNDPQAMAAYLKQNDPRWPQLFEEGGIETSRYAAEMGIQIVPTMILVNKEGKVVNRNIRADELETELQRQLK
jgi:thiol-disulfide isomerase/thioredoxin